MTATVELTNPSPPATEHNSEPAAQDKQAGGDVHPAAFVQRLRWRARQRDLSTVFTTVTPGTPYFCDCSSARC